MAGTETGRLAFFDLARHSIRNFFKHRMTTYAATLAYRSLFGLFPFVLLVVVLLAVLRFDAFFERLIDLADSGSQPKITGALESVAGEGRKQAEPLERLIGQTRERAGGGLLSFSAAVSLYSVYVAARTLTEALNAAYEVVETRPGWKRIAISAVFGPALALLTIAAIGLMLAGPQLIESLAGLVGLDDLFVSFWSLLRLPVALVLLGLVLSVVYHFAPNVEQSYRLVTPGAAVAVGSWVSVSLGFSFYLTNFADYGATYGSLGAAIGLLFYLYLSASVILFGAEVNATILRGFGWSKEGQ